MAIINSEVTSKNAEANVGHDPLLAKLMILAVSLCGLCTFAFGLARDVINAEWLALAIGALLMALAVLMPTSAAAAVPLTALASIALFAFFTSSIVQASPSVALVTLTVGTWSLRLLTPLRIRLDVAEHGRLKIRFAHVICLVSVSAIGLAAARQTSSSAFLEYSVLNPILLGLGLLLAGLVLLTTWDIWQRFAVAMAVYLPVVLAIVQDELSEVSIALFFLSELAIAFGWCVSVFGLANAIGFSLISLTAGEVNAQEEK